MRSNDDTKVVTIRDVAKMSNVSIATVSRVINGGRVKEERKKRVLSAIKKLDYVPNNSSRNVISMKSSKKIQIIIPNLDDNCYREMIKGFRMGAKLYNYSSEISDYENSNSVYEELCFKIASNNDSRGIVLVGKKRELNNKVTINMKNKLLSLDLSDRYKADKIGIYFKNDDYLYNYFLDMIFASTKVVNVHSAFDASCDYYVVKSVEDAAFLINSGIEKKIYILEEINQVGKLINNIEFFPIDFFAIGLALSRIAIKKLTGILQENDPGLILKVN